MNPIKAVNHKLSVQDFATQVNVGAKAASAVTHRDSVFAIVIKAVAYAATGRLI